MTCHDAIRAIDAMLDGEIGDDERMELDAHLGGCEACRLETEERRAFSDRLGRGLREGFPASAPGGRSVIFRKSRFPWIRAAAVILAGIAIGFVGARGGLFDPASAEARQVANLSALKSAYERRDHELAANLEQEAGNLDRKVSLAPDGALRDAGAICVMNAAAGLAGDVPPVLPAHPARRAREVAHLLSSPQWAHRGQGVKALRQFAPGDAQHVESQIVNLKGTSRTFTELWVRSVRAPSEPPINVTVEANGVAMHFVQHLDGRVRVEAGSEAARAVYEGLNLWDFRVRHPKIASLLRLQGVDGDFSLAGVHQTAPEIEGRPTVFMPVVVWETPGSESEDCMEALGGFAVMAELTRAGVSVKESEKQARQAMREIQEMAPPGPPEVHADPELVQVFLADVREHDLEWLALERERLNDELAALEKRVLEKQRRLARVRQAAKTLNYTAR